MKLFLDSGAFIARALARDQYHAVLGLQRTRTRIRKDQRDDHLAYFEGFRSKDALQPDEQNTYVLPPKTELPAARFGSTIIPHTGSFSMPHLLVSIQSCGLNRRSVIEFITTDTELKPIAAPAMIGFSTIPIPANTPAAIGMSAVL